MNEVEIELLEEYKHLEKLLSDAFKVQHGVSEYIERLENNKNLGSRVVSSWMDDYYNLKHVRYIRNKITHDSETSECEENDIYFVQDFYERFMNQEDPLALLRKYKRKQEEEMLAKQRAQQKIKLKEFEEHLQSLNDENHVYIGKKISIEDTPFSEDHYYSKFGQIKNRPFNEYEYKHKEEKDYSGLKVLLWILLTISIAVAIVLFQILKSRI